MLRNPRSIIMGAFTLLMLSAAAAPPEAVASPPPKENDPSLVDIVRDPVSADSTFNTTVSMEETVPIGLAANGDDSVSAFERTGQVPAPPNPDSTEPRMLTSTPSYSNLLKEPTMDATAEARSLDSRRSAINNKIEIYDFFASTHYAIDSSLIRFAATATGGRDFASRTELMMHSQGFTPAWHQYDFGFRTSAPVLAA